MRVFFSTIKSSSLLQDYRLSLHEQWMRCVSILSIHNRLNLGKKWSLKSMFWVGEPQRKKSTCFENDSHTLLAPFCSNYYYTWKFPQKCWFCALRQTSMHYPAKFLFFRNLSHCAIQTLIYCLCNGCISDIFKYKVLSIQKPIVVDVNCQYITFVYVSTFILSI